jgi:hypothetical protein
MIESIAVGACLLGASATCVVAARDTKPGNVAPLAKTSASSTKPGHPLWAVNDGRLDNEWSTDSGQVTGQWLRFDWDSPQQICGVAMIATGPWAQTIDVQVDQDGTWVSVAKSGSAEQKAPESVFLSFAPVKTKSLRFAFEGGAAYREVEIYSDRDALADAVSEYRGPVIAVAGDLRGHLMGTVSFESGSQASVDAQVTVTGRTPNGEWRETTATDGLGSFEVPLPFATEGEINVVAVKGAVVKEQSFDSRAISTQLRPRSDATAVDQLSLCGTWEFAADPPAGYPANGRPQEWSKIKVPAHWEMEGFSAETGRGVYRKSFRVPENWQGKRVKLRADAIYSHAQVWVNGHRVGVHEGGFTPFEVDVTDAVRLGSENVVEVLVEARSDSHFIDQASLFAYFELAGIWQPIEVYATAPIYVSHLAVSTDVDRQGKDAKLQIEADVVNERARLGAMAIRWRLFDPHGVEVALLSPTTRVELGPWQRKTVRWESMVRVPSLWNAEQPRLYKLLAETSDSAGVKDVVRETIGFRKIAVDGRVLKLNGVPVKFRGVCRLDAHPLMGRALTPAVDRLDMQMIKDANFNMVRASIAPPHPASLDAADEVGLYIENEGPACWGNRFRDLRFAAMYRGIMCEFLERDRNHPSVVVWSICNESAYGEVFSMARTKMTQLDPTRIYSATDCDNTLDILTYHYPLPFLDRIAEYSKADRPVFYDEVTPVLPHGVCDLGLFQDLDPGMGDYWIEGLPETQRAIDDAPNQVGVVQFAWVDDKFDVPNRGLRSWRSGQGRIRFTDSVYKVAGRGILGENAWGTVDGWRRPRPVYWLSKKLYSPIWIKEEPLTVPKEGGPVQFTVRNRNQFADLDEYVCRWEIGGRHGTTRLQTAPMSAALACVDTRGSVRPSDALTLRFFDSHNRLVDAYRLGFKAHAIPRFPNSGKPARINEPPPYLDGASPVRLVGKNSELAYDRINGELYRGLAGGEVIFTQGPKLHVQKAEAPMLDFPTGAAENLGDEMLPSDVPGDSIWKIAGSAFRTEGGKAVLDWNGTYGKEFEGGFKIAMDDSGDAEFHYEFTYKGPDMWVREIGLEFQLPADFDNLAWDRKAEYSYYPEDHIGRPQGRAVAHPLASQAVPVAKRSYALDDHPLGCNDFRSVKRHIFSASLTNLRGQGVKIYSDGTQSVRATMGMYDVSLKVLDYYGGAGWGARNCWHCGPGRLVKTGEVLKGTVRLRLVGK